MIPSKIIPPFLRRLPFLGVLLLLLCLGGCSSGPPPDPQPALLADAVLAPFIQFARSSDCTETRNRLFVIDEQMVFWERAGNCGDSAYEQKLWGTTLDRVLCTAADSLGGPQTTAPDPTRKPLFDTMVTHLTKPDLGLGSGHTVRQVL